jgi:tRNA pseudouridine55 synthase
VDATIRCSSGTYIRALARDLGAALGTGGHLTALRRTAVGPYRLDQARTLEDLSERTHLTPLAEAAAAAFPRLDLTADDARRLAHGVRIPVPASVIPAPGAQSPVAAFGPDGALIALVTSDSDKLRTLAVFAPG